MSTRSNTAFGGHRLLARRVFEASRAFMIWCHGARGACTNSTLAKPFFLSGQLLCLAVRMSSPGDCQNGTHGIFRNATGFGSLTPSAARARSRGGVGSRAPAYYGVKRLLLGTAACLNGCGVVRQKDISVRCVALVARRQKFGSPLLDT
jgi:hypothetical protein